MEGSVGRQGGETKAQEGARTSTSAHSGSIMRGPANEDHAHLAEVAEPMASDEKAGAMIGRSATGSSDLGFEVSCDTVAQPIGTAEALPPTGRRLS